MKNRNDISTDRSVEVVFPLSNGNRVLIRVDRLMSKHDFNRITQLLLLAEESLVDKQKGET